MTLFFLIIVAVVTGFMCYIERIEFNEARYAMYLTGTLAYVYFSDKIDNYFD